MQPHYFTLQEANAALSIIRPLIEEIQSIRRHILTTRPQIWSALERSSGNGGNPALSKSVVEFQRLDDLVHQVLATGAEIKDLSSGLLDFRAWRGDREVYLCWKYGEAAIEFWHEVDTGFGGRRPIEEY
jgi:hypothetical protein